MDNHVSLVEPRPDLCETYRSLVEEFTAAGENLIPFPLEYPHDDFNALVDKLQTHSRGIDIPDRFVANTTFWLLDQHSEIVGVSNLRHELTPRLEREGGHIGYGVRPSKRRKGYGTLLLKETLNKAKHMGLNRVLVTTPKEHSASIRVILKNGGIFESEIYSPQHGETIGTMLNDLSERRRGSPKACRLRWS